MLTRLSRALLRVFPAILLVVVGLLAALFRRRSGHRTVAKTLVPVSAGHTPPPVRRSGAAIAFLVILLGIGSILVLFSGDGAFWQPGSQLTLPEGEDRGPVAALSRPEIDLGPGKTSEQVNPGGSAPKGSPGEQGVALVPRAPDPNSPSFDTVRVEPDGEFIVAGRATPNGTVELMVDGKPTARVVADANGQFAIVPPALPTGNSEIGLRVTDGRGGVRQSRDSVAVAVYPSRDAKPLVALTSPDKATVVFSQPGSSATSRRSAPDGTPSSGAVPADDASDSLAAFDAARSNRVGHGNGISPGDPDAGASNELRSGTSRMPRPTPPPSTVVKATSDAPAKVVSVDAQEGGRLYVSGQAPAGATVRLYLNDTLIAPATVGRDGTVTFTIGRGVKPGDYKVRLDQVDAVSGKVRSRVEVPFSVPDGARIAEADRSIAAAPEASHGRDAGGKVASNTSPPAVVGRRGGNTDDTDGSRDSISVATSAMTHSSNGVRDPFLSETAPGAVYVPEVRTARIERGDSLWAISRRAYGEGDRYTAIYDANQDQIRDPDLIYPGQVFVLPSEDAIDPVQDGKRG